MRASSLLMLLLSALVVSAASRTLLNGISQASEGDQNEQHQRILAELEEVHQLRERMLQQGMCILSPCVSLVGNASLSICICSSICSATCKTTFVQLQQPSLRR
jgi:hypothetical protein